MLVFIKHLILALGYRTGDNQRRTGIVNQYRVDLIHDCVVMFALNEILGRSSHVITQIVKAELVVRTERDIAFISLTALLRIRTILINAIHAQTVEHINRAIPLGITFGQIIIYRNNMHALVRKRVKEHRQSSHKGLTLTGSHLGNLTLMEHHATYQLYIVMNHVPCDFITASHPVVVVNGLIAIYLHKIKTGSQIAVEIIGSHHHRLVFRKATSGIFYDGKHLGQHLVQNLFIPFFDIFVQIIYLAINALALFYRQLLNRAFQLSYLIFLRLHMCGNALLNYLCASTKIIVAQFG